MNWLFLYLNDFTLYLCIFKFVYDIFNAIYIQGKPSACRLTTKVLLFFIVHSGQL